MIPVKVEQRKVYKSKVQKQRLLSLAAMQRSTLQTEEGLPPLVGNLSPLIRPKHSHQQFNTYKVQAPVQTSARLLHLIQQQSQAPSVLPSPMRLHESRYAPSQLSTDHLKTT